MGNQIPKDAISRVDGRLKVTGAARYFAEFEAPNMSYCVMATSDIARGTITAIDTKAAEKSPGVLAVFTHLNMPDVPGWQTNNSPNTANVRPTAGGQKFKMLGSNQILFDGQPIALVIADTLERAQYAARLVKATYQKDEPKTSLEANKSKAVAGGRGGDYKRGEAEAYKTAAYVIEEEYKMPIHVHNPMELHGILAMWQGDDKLTVYAKTQGVKSTQRTLAAAFKLPADNVHVLSEFVGGGFGMALKTWPQEVAVAAAAKKIGRPVKMMMSRSQMFTSVGYRPAAIQKIGMGASADGKLVGIKHDATAITSTYEDFSEGVVNMTKFMYACPNVATSYKLVPLDIGVPIWMRGPGEATGAYALESAMDELAFKLGLDPIEFRLRNYAETDPEKNKPYSSKYVKEAYQLGAEKIGWNKRNNQPGTTSDGEWKVGYGMSTGVFGASRGGATCKATLMADGRLLVQSATSDIGPGTATAMTQIAHEVTGVPINKIKFELGDSALPQAGSQGGSTTTSTVGSAVYEACDGLRTALLGYLASKEGSAFKDAKAADVVWEKGYMSLKTDAGQKVAMVDVLKQQSLPSIEITKESKGNAEAQKYAMYSFSIHFAEVRVHPKTGVVRVKNVVTVADSGKIVSPKTAASQMIGGVTGGIGMALTEEAVIDHRFGRFVNNNLADYHMPVSADVPHIETIFIDKPDLIINPMGAKGMGEIALIGFAAAVANAVFNATGKRIRELPITPDKIIG